MPINLSGYVYDDAGAALSGKQVDAVSLTDNLVKATTTTLASGKWTFSALADDTYKVKITISPTQVIYANIGDSEVQYKAINLVGTITAAAGQVWDFLAGTVKLPSAATFVGTATSLLNSVAGRAYLAIRGSSAGGAVELSTDAADANGNALGVIQFADKNSTNAATKLVAYIVGTLTGATANNRGGGISFFTRADNVQSAPVQRMVVGADGTVDVSGTLVAGAIQPRTLVFPNDATTVNLAAAAVDLGDAGAMSGRVKIVKAWGGNIAISATGSAGIVTRPGTGTYQDPDGILASLTLQNGDSMMFYSQNDYWWVI